MPNSEIDVMGADTMTQRIFQFQLNDIADFGFKFSVCGIEVNRETCADERDRNWEGATISCLLDGLFFNVCAVLDVVVDTACSL